MAGVWPNLDISDMEMRIRTYVNEATPFFFTQSRIWKMIGVGAEFIASKSSCIRRIIDTQTIANSATIPFKASICHHIEYIPATGLPRMLVKIDPIKVGHTQIDTTAAYPQFWYKFGSEIGLYPVPDAIYSIKLFTAEEPKIISTLTPITIGAGTTQWTSGGGWVSGDGITHSGSATAITYNTTLTSTDQYTISFQVVGLGASASVTLYAGAYTPTTITTSGYYTQNITSTLLSFSATGDASLYDITIASPAQISTSTDQVEIPTTLQNLLMLYTVTACLEKDNKQGIAKMIDSICMAELDYLRNTTVNITPNAWADLRYS